MLDSIEFIVFEGGDCSGKTTVAKLLSDHLNEIGKPTFLTREPNGAIRDIFLNNDFNPVTNLLLIAANRYEHNLQIQQAIKEGKIVICDRYTDSTIAYQHFGAGVDLDLIEVLNKNFVLLNPDVTFFLRTSPEVAMERLKLRRSNEDQGETEAYLKKIDNGFMHTCRNNKTSIIIDSNRTIDKVFNEIKHILKV